MTSLTAYGSATRAATSTTTTTASAQSHLSRRRISGRRLQYRTARASLHARAAEGGGGLRAEQEDLRRVVQPQQQRCERRRRAEGRGLRRAREIETDRPAAELEQERGDECAPQDWLPGHPPRRQVAVDDRDEARDEPDRDGKV